MEASPFRNDILAGKVALITGGGSGIGFEITRQLGLHGAAVFILGRREEVLKSSCEALRAEGIKAAYCKADVRKPEDCEAGVQNTIATYGRLDILINCAAGNFLAVAEELTPNGFKTVMEIDAVGTFVTSRAAFPELQKSGSGCIVNISATLHYGATWYQTHASAAKAAVDSLTRSLALEWGEFGIRVNGVAPGPIQETAGLAKLAPTTQGSGDDVVRSAIPIGRWGRKFDIAMAVLFLVSSGATFITGDTMVVDGANWMHRPQLVPRQAVSRTSRAVEAGSRKVGTAKSKL